MTPAEITRKDQKYYFPNRDAAKYQIDRSKLGFNFKRLYDSVDRFGLDPGEEIESAIINALRDGHISDEELYVAQHRFPLGIHERKSQRQLAAILGYKNALPVFHMEEAISDTLFAYLRVKVEPN